MGDENGHKPRRVTSCKTPAVSKPPKTIHRSTTVDASDPEQKRTGPRNHHDVDERLGQSLNVEAERRRRHSQRKRQQLVRLSSSSYVPLPLDHDDFTASRRSLVRSQRSRIEAQRSVDSQRSVEEPKREGDEPVVVEEEQEEDEIVDPNIDGGWAWLVMCASFVLIFIVDGISFSFGVFLDVLTKEFGQDKSTTALVGSVLSGLYLGAGPIASALAEKFGYRVVGVSGAFISAGAFLASSWSPNITTLIVLYGAVGGFGFCFMYLTSMVTTSLYFDKKRPIAIGVASCGSGIGIFVFPLIMEKLFSVLSWNNCIRVQAGCILLCSLCALAFKPLQKQAERQQEKKTFKEDLKRLVDLSLFKRPVFLILTAMGVLATIGISIPFIFIKDMAQSKGVAEGQATWLISMMGITNTVGRLLVGALVYFAPVSPLVILALGCIIGGILTTLTVFFNTFPVLAVYACIFGTVYALDAALSTEILARTLGRDSVAGSFGLLCLVRGVAFAAGGPIAGTLYDNTGKYDATFYFAGAAVILTGVLAVVAFIVDRAAKRSRDNSYDVTSDSNSNSDAASNSSHSPSHHRRSLLDATTSRPSYGIVNEAADNNTSVQNVDRL